MNIGASIFFIGVLKKGHPKDFQMTL